MKIHSKDVKKVLDSIRDEFFSVTFIKRTTGELRHLNGRKGVTRHLKGGSAAYDFESKGLVSVYDVEKEGYRAIPIENVLEIRASGAVYEVEK